WLLDWSEVETPASRRPGLPLWDGDLVLWLTGLEGRRGAETIAAFAALADDWSGVDLVSWSYPSPEVQRRARAEGVEMRVHPVGPPPRLAESSWLAHASAAIVSDGPAISSALLLRVLASGCPLVWVRPTGPAE